MRPDCSDLICAADEPFTEEWPGTVQGGFRASDNPQLIFVDKIGLLKTSYIC
jgi:hypothetical protein